MFKIINSPPFDDFSKKLFATLYGNKNKYKLKNASFVYMWSNAIAYKDTEIVANQFTSTINIANLPKFLIFMNCYRQDIVGNNKFFNDIDDMYKLYLEVASLPDTTQTKMLFKQHYFKYASNMLDRTAVDNIIEQACKNEIVVLFVKDIFSISSETAWSNQIPELSEYFINLFDYYPNKQFILVSSLENLGAEIKRDNCIIVPMGGDITNQLSQYENYNPDITKSNNIKHNFISLNRNLRTHRLYLCSSLYGRGIDKYGDITMLTMSDKSELSHAISYDFSIDPCYDIANTGYQQLIVSDKQVKSSEYDIYDNSTWNDNLSNFKDNLQSKYNDTVIEFVSETSFSEKAFNITEKTMHFIYGGNIPIMISSPGSVEFLRSMGLDMFDDIVDHSYDLILNNTARINAAIDNNIHILTENNIAEVWNKHKYRIENNLNFVKTGKLRKFYEQRFWDNILGLKL
jgi:hypothetical protein